jgi:translation initiation factor IF-2
LPEAGEQVLQAPDEDKAKTAVEYRQEMADRLESSAQLAEQGQRMREKAAAEEAAAAAEADGTTAKPDEGPSIKYQNFIIKADVAGSVEALTSHIQEIGNNEVQTKVLRSSVGLISEYDVDHAATSNSIIVNFNNQIQPHIRHRASENKVRIIDHSVIYHVADEVKDALSDLLPMSVSHRVVGEADVLQVFAINIKKRVTRNIAGCRVRNGAIKRTSMVKVLRGGEVIHDGKFALDSLLLSTSLDKIANSLFLYRQNRHAQTRQEGRHGDGQGHRVRYRLRRFPGPASRRPGPDLRNHQGEALLVKTVAKIVSKRDGQDGQHSMVDGI